MSVILRKHSKFWYPFIKRNDLEVMADDDGDYHLWCSSIDPLGHILDSWNVVCWRLLPAEQKLNAARFVRFDVTLYSNKVMFRQGSLLVDTEIDWVSTNLSGRWSLSCPASVNAPSPAAVAFHFEDPAEATLYALRAA